MPTAMYLLCTP
uniref:Uncharacterized protein n=1 Tax=Lepeophtheirus salmonis TaxID=72036 RepID=A0A0K2V1C9_LEPSM